MRSEVVGHSKTMVHVLTIMCEQGTALLNGNVNFLGHNTIMYHRYIYTNTSLFCVSWTAGSRRLRVGQDYWIKCHEYFVYVVLSKCKKCSEKDFHNCVLADPPIGLKVTANHCPAPWYKVGPHKLQLKILIFFFPEKQATIATPCHVYPQSKCWW